MTFSAGMMQTAANEAGASEEKAKGTGGLCVCGGVCAGFTLEGPVGVLGQNI